MHFTFSDELVAQCNREIVLHSYIVEFLARLIVSKKDLSLHVAHRDKNENCLLKAIK